MPQIDLVELSKEERACLGIVEKTSCPKSKWRMGSKKNLSLLQGASYKNVWRLIQGKGLRVQVIRAKYIACASIEDWERNPIK